MNEDTHFWTSQKWRREIANIMEFFLSGEELPLNSVNSANSGKLGKPLKHELGSI